MLLQGVEKSSGPIWGLSIEEDVRDPYGAIPEDAQFRLA